MCACEWNKSDDILIPWARSLCLFLVAHDSGMIQISQAMQCCLVLSIFDGLSRLSRLWVGLLIALGTLQSQAERTHHLYHRPDIACHCVEFSGLLVRQSDVEAENVAKRE